MLNLILKSCIFLLAHFLLKFDIKSVLNVFYVESKMSPLFLLLTQFKSIKYLNLWKLQILIMVLMLYDALLLIHYNNK